MRRLAVLTRTSAKALVAMLDVKVDLVRDLGALGSLYALGAKESREGDEKKTESEATEYHFMEERSEEGEGCA